MPEEIKEVQKEQQAQGEEVQPEAMHTSEEPQEEVSQEAQLPDDANERTKTQFEKLKQHNKEMQEKLAQYEGKTEKPPSLLESYALTGNYGQQPTPQAQPPAAMPPTPNLSQEQVDKVVRELVDQDGYLNQAELEHRLGKAEEAEKRAREAERIAQEATERIARYEADRQAKELHDSYPELDPSNDKFDAKAYDLVKNEMLNQLVATGQQDAVSAAKKMEEYFRAEQPKQENQVIQQREQVQTRPTSGTASRSTASTIDDLRKRSLHNTDAMDERIRLAGI